MRIIFQRATSALLIAVVAASMVGGELPSSSRGRASVDEAAEPGRETTERAATADGQQKHHRRGRLAATQVPARVDRLHVFGGLGAWVDLYDYDDLRADRTVRMLKRRGVRTLYVQTGWPSTRSHVVPAAGRWLVAGHRAGLKVVGWYLPHYRNVGQDVQRTLAIARYRHRGHRFDGLGIDVEFRGAVRSRKVWMRGVADHARIVRARRPRFPIASIPPTPLQMQVAPSYWKGFPWRAIAKHSDAILLMSYWSDRSGCPRIRRHCAYEFTKRNVRLTRHLSGVPRMPIHIIGGVGDRISGKQLRAFVRGAIHGGADGASIYDLVTTRPAWWRSLGKLRRLGKPGKARGPTKQAARRR